MSGSPVESGVKMPRSPSGLTQSLVDLATGNQGWPPSVMVVSRQCLLDWIGVTIAGATDRAIDHIVDEALDRGSSGRSTLIGRSERLSLLDAALANGVAGHILDYDDAHQAIRGHGTAPIMPAVLAAAEAMERTVGESLAAFACGYEACARMGLMLGPAHYVRGFHTTATAGIFGAVVATARLIGLDAEQTRHALGIAGTMSSGLVANFGSMCKALHAGRAASSGLHAARLAARGFTSSHDAIEAANGFINAVGGERRDELALKPPPSNHHLPDTLFKMHASCYGTHSAIIAAITARRRGVTPDKIVTIDVWVQPGAEQACSIPSPMTGLQAKFSLSYLVAMALCGLDTSDPESFPDALPDRPEVTALAARVSLHYPPDMAGMSARISLGLADGSVVEESADAGKPERDLAEQQDRLESKFRSLVESRLSSGKATRILEIINTPDKCPVADLLETCRR